MRASGSALSRRLSEVVGVALFAAALIWLIALATYDPNDPVWFFSTGTHDEPANFAGRVGAFLGELSYQVLGYASYLIPAVIAVAGWHYFWCRAVDAVYTKLTGAVMLFACGSAFLGLTLGRVDFGPRPFRAGGYLGEWLGGLMSEYLSRTGSVIVILALIVAAVILATQFSFGRLFSAIFAALGRRWRRGVRSVSAVARRAPQGQGAPRRAREVRQEGRAGRGEGRDEEDRKDRQALDSARAVAARRRSGRAAARDEWRRSTTTFRSRRQRRPRRSSRRSLSPGPRRPRRCRCQNPSAWNGGSAPSSCRRCRYSTPPRRS